MDRTGGTRQATGEAGRHWRLFRRFVAASAVATVTSQLVFLVTYAIAAAPLLATVLAWLAGAIPNFLLNRRTWGSRGRAALRGELLRFAAMSVTTALLATLATRRAEDLALQAFGESRSTQVVIVWGAFLGTYLVMFVVKYFLMDRLVFTRRKHGESG